MRLKCILGPSLRIKYKNNSMNILRIFIYIFRNLLNKTFKYILTYLISNKYNIVYFLW